MLNVTVPGAPKPPTQYPCLKRSVATSQIVLFSGRKTGVCLAPGNTDNKAGHYGTDWVPADDSGWMSLKQVIITDDNL